MIARRTAAAASVAACALLMGCAGADVDDVVEATDALRTSEWATTVAHPKGLYTAKISARGNNCGSDVEGRFTNDGESLEFRFMEPGIYLGPGELRRIGDCTLAIELVGASAVQHAVSRLEYRGVAWIDGAGTTMRTTAKYAFRGDVLPATSVSAQQGAPLDGFYKLVPTIPEAGRGWSGCSAKQTLDVLDRLILQNNPTRTGSISMNAAGDWTNYSWLTIDLPTKACTPPKG